VRQARLRWPQLVIDQRARRLIFLDETWFSTAMTRLRGYAPRGQRLIDAVPHGHWKITTLVCGLTGRGLIAPMVLDGALDGDAFAAYVEHVLAKETRRGDLLILDNLPAHKTAAVRAALERCGIAHLYLPPYSPDLNPIENAFSKLKNLARSAAERTIEGLWSALGQLIDLLQPPECHNYFRHCGYATKT
jgi:transposase